MKNKKPLLIALTLVILSFCIPEKNPPVDYVTALTDYANESNQQLSQQKWALFCDAVDNQRMAPVPCDSAAMTDFGNCLSNVSYGQGSVGLCIINLIDYLNTVCHPRAVPIPYPFYSWP